MIRKWSPVSEKQILVTLTQQHGYRFDIRFDIRLDENLPVLTCVAQQQVSGSSAQLEAAQTNLNVASKELVRQKQLFQKQYSSQGALDRGQAQWEVACAQEQAQQAQTRAAQTQTGIFSVCAPFNGVVSDVAVTFGDMAMPGRPMLTMHDPSALRVSTAVP